MEDNEPNEFNELDTAPIDDIEVPPELMVPELSPEERQKMLIEKMKLKNKVLRYKELFPKMLENFDYRMADLDQMEIKDLEYLIDELSIAVNTRNAAGLTKMLYFESCRVVEFGGAFVGLKMNGLSEALQQNQAIHDVLNEISLKYENDMYMAPEVRLAYLTSMTMLSLHKLNSTESVVREFLTAKVPEKMQEDYRDL